MGGGLVDVATGDVLLVHRDVVRPGALPLVVGRVYRSSWRAGRWFGRSWASALDQRLRVTPERVTGVFGDGRVLSWRCTPATDGPRPVTGLPHRADVAARGRQRRFHGHRPAGRADVAVRAPAWTPTG